MSDRFEVRLAGTGGQGMILAGIILSEAAAIGAGKHVTQTQSYGPEARGGASKAEVIISEDEVDYPKVIQADLLLAMSQEACDRYGDEVKPEGWLIIDADHIKRAPPHLHQVRAPIHPVQAMDPRCVECGHAVQMNRDQCDRFGTYRSVDGKQLGNLMP